MSWTDRPSTPQPSANRLSGITIGVMVCDARRPLRHDFGTRKIDVATQGALNHRTGAATLMDLLDTPIRACTAVVCVRCVRA